MKLYRSFILFLLLSLLSISAAFTWPFHRTYFLPASTSQEVRVTSHNTWLSNEMRVIESHTYGLNEKVLRLGLLAYMNVKKRGYATNQLLTIVDYSLPSTAKRLWVFDMKNGKTLFNTWVSHGKNSGGIIPTSFSNHRGSLKSSLGVFITENAYVGGNGYSLRLKGLENGINDNAYQRSIVIHGARYVNPDTIRRYGQIGRSWGCLAVSTALSTSLINTIKENTVVVAYYPDHNWLSHSRFLAG